MPLKDENKPEVYKLLDKAIYKLDFMTSALKDEGICECKYWRESLQDQCDSIKLVLDDIDNELYDYYDCFAIHQEEDGEDHCFCED